MWQWCSATTHNSLDEQCWAHLLSLHHLLVEEVRKGALRIELPRPLGAHEHTVLAHQTPSADGYQRNAVAAHALEQVKVSALHLSAGRDCPVGRKPFHRLTAAAETAGRAADAHAVCSPGCIRVPHQHVGVGPRDDTPFARVQVVDLCGVGAGYSHETILVHFPCDLEPTGASELGRSVQTIDRAAQPT